MKIGYYHVYNRGAHKAVIFNDRSDYRRFISLLFVCNSMKPVDISKMPEDDIYSIDRGEPLVEVIAYCLMPNHFHIALHEHKDGNMTTFLRKVCTGYSMYYNIKYKHSGTIIQGKYKAKHITDEEYMNVVISYIHLNPYGIKEPNLSSEMHSEPEYAVKATEYSRIYEYSSFKDYLGVNRLQGVILTKVGPSRE